MKAILKWNAELAKSIWLELSMQRLIAMPAIIGLISLLIITSASHDEVRSMLHYVAIGGIVLLGMLWGVKTSADAILDEYNEKTWDWQKMSVIGPWKLAWGKLFGSTIYNWYGAGICFLIYILTSFGADDPLKELKIGLLLLIGMISVHGLMILISLQMIRKNDGRSKIKSNRIFISGLLVVGFVSRLFSASFFDSFETSLSWYGLVSGGIDITIVGAIFYCCWIVAGLYRAMRAELQFSDAPVWWVAFMLSSFFMHYGYFAPVEKLGFAGGVSAALFLTFSEFLFLLYFMALSEPKDIVNFRLLETSWTSGNRKTFFQNLPLWLTSLPLVFIFGILAVVFMNMAFAGSQVEDFLKSLHIRSSGKSYMGMIAIFGFVLRDLGILLLLNFSDRRKRADSALLIYLLLLYVLLPLLTRDWGIGAAFYPNFAANNIVMVAFPVAEAAVVLFLLQRRWKEIRLSA